MPYFPLLLVASVGCCVALSPGGVLPARTNPSPTLSRAALLMSATPPAPESDAKKLSPLDSVLVKFGMKTEEECSVVEEGENVMEKIKCAGRAGIVSYIICEWIFWLTAILIACGTYYSATGSWPDFSVDEDKAKVAGSVFAFVNVARFAVPLRVGLALSTTPWVDENIVKKYLVKDGDEEATDN